MSKSDLGKQRQDLVLSICKPDCDDGIEVLMSAERWDLKAAQLTSGLGVCVISDRWNIQNINTN